MPVQRCIEEGKLTPYCQQTDDWLQDCGEAAMSSNCMGCVQLYLDNRDMDMLLNPKALEASNAVNLCTDPVLTGICDGQKGYERQHVRLEQLRF